jgi:hypothetical protein
MWPGFVGLVLPGDGPPYPDLRQLYPRRFRPFYLAWSIGYLFSWQPLHDVRILNHRTRKTDSVLFFSTSPLFHRFDWKYPCLAVLLFSISTRQVSRITDTLLLFRGVSFVVEVIL